MKMRIIALTLAAVVLMSVAVACSSKDDEIIVGSKAYTEQLILGNMLTILIEQNTDLKVTYKGGMASNVLFEAAKNGEVDVYVDYTGTVYANYLGNTDMKSADEVYNIAVQELSSQFKLKMLNPIGFNNTYCLAVTPETAEQYGLKTYSDLAGISGELIFGGGFEFLNRADGMVGLKSTYSMEFKDEKALEGVLRYTSMANGETQVTDAFSTDGMLDEYELVVLEDDKNFFPPYFAAAIINEEVAENHPELVELLGKLDGLLTDSSMRELNYKVDVLKEDPKVVAETFLKDQGLIK